MFPSSIIKKLQARVFEIGLTPIIPLSGIDSELFRNLNEIGLEKHIIKIEKLLQTKIIPRQKGVISNKQIVFKDKIGRLRDIDINSEGEIFLITDEKNSSIWKLVSSKKN